MTSSRAEERGRIVITKNIQDYSWRKEERRRYVYDVKCPNVREEKIITLWRIIKM